LAVAGDLTLSGNLLFAVDKSLSPSNSVLAVGGNLANAGTGVLTVTNLGPALAIGDRFYLCTRAMAGGSFLRVIGAGAVWNNHLADDGSISVAATTLPLPVFTSLTTSGANLIAAGTNAPVGYDYRVLTSTNLTAPLSAWLPVATNSFSSGGFAITNAIRTDRPNGYYILVVP